MGMEEYHHSFLKAVPLATHYGQLEHQGQLWKPDRGDRHGSMFTPTNASPPKELAGMAVGGTARTVGTGSTYYHTLDGATVHVS